MRKELLTEKVNVSIEEFEQKHSLTDARLGKDPVPFGFINAKWVALKGQMQPGDELWYFKSSQETWRMLCGRQGIALVRDGDIVTYLVTLMS